MTPDMQTSMKHFIHGLNSEQSILEKLNTLAHKPGGEITFEELSSLWPRIEKYVRLLVGEI
jgi:hypothetical protein